MTYTNCDLILSVKDAEDHEKWLKTRDLGIGGSDAAVIMGMNSYKSPYQLWMEKTGQVEPPDLSDNQYVYWGTKNEGNIADWFQEETGKKVKTPGDTPEQGISVHAGQCGPYCYRRKCRP